MPAYFIQDVRFERARPLRTNRRFLRGVGVALGKFFLMGTSF